MPAIRLWSLFLILLFCKNLFAQNRFFFDYGWGSDNFSQQHVGLQKNTTSLNYLRTHRFDVDNDFFDFNYIYKNNPNNILTLTGGALIGQPKIIHQPYVLIKASLEKPIQQVGSMIFDLESRSYPQAKTYTGSYALIYEKVNDFIIIPKIYLTQAYFDHSNEQNLNSAFTLRLIHTVKNLQSSLGFSYGKEAWMEQQGLLSTDLQNINVQIKINYKNGNYLQASWQRETRPLLNKINDQTSLGLGFAW